MTRSPTGDAGVSDVGMTLSEALAYLKPDPFSNGTISLRAPKAREAVETIEAALATPRSKDREDGARWMRSPKLRTPLTEAEREFIAEMSHEDDGRANHWQNFDPDFRQRDIARLLRLGWAERRERNGYREYRWTEAGRLALAEQEARNNG